MSERVKGKNSKASKLIESYCAGFGIEYTEINYQNFKKIFECFSNLNSGKNIIDYSIIKRRPMTTLLPLMYEEFLKEEILDTRLIIEFLSQFRENKNFAKTINNIDTALNNDFGPIGITYKVIIKDLYFDSPFPNISEILSKTNLSRSAFAYRKKAAVMLVACILWKECLKIYRPSKKALEQAEINAGRHQGISTIYNGESASN